MSIFEDDLIIDMTIQVLNDTIVVQESQLENLNERISMLQLEHRKETARIVEENANAIQKLLESMKNIKRDYESKLATLHEQMNEYTIQHSNEQILLIKAEQISSILKSWDEWNVALEKAQHELQSQDEAITKQFSEISELKKKLENENKFTDKLAKQNLELNIQLETTSVELERSREDFKESCKLMESIKTSGEQNEAKLLQNMLQLRKKIDQTFTSALQLETSNAELISENGNLSNVIKRLEQEIEALEVTKEQHLEKVDKENSALHSFLKQKEKTFVTLVTDSMEYLRTIQVLRKDVEKKDESLCKLYTQNHDEHREKDEVIKGLKATIADNVKEIILLRNDLSEVLRNRF